MYLIVLPRCLFFLTTHMRGVSLKFRIRHIYYSRKFWSAWIFFNNANMMSTYNPTKSLIRFKPSSNRPSKPNIHACKHSCTDTHINTCTKKLHHYFDRSSVGKQLVVYCGPNILSKVSDLSRGRPEGFLFSSYYTKVFGRALLHSLDFTTLPLIFSL